VREACPSLRALVADRASLNTFPFARREGGMRLSTALIVTGILLIVIPLPVPIPFIGLFVGTIVLLVGLVLRLLGE
jgi:hypothetical protein